VVRTLARYTVSKTETTLFTYCSLPQYRLERRSANDRQGALLSLQVQRSSTEGSAREGGDRWGLWLSLESTGNQVNRREQLIFFLFVKKI